MEEVKTQDTLLFSFCEVYVYSSQCVDRCTSAVTHPEELRLCRVSVGMGMGMVMVLVLTLARWEA